MQITKFCTVGGDKMGLFGGHNKSGSQQQSESDRLIEEQFNQNQAEMERKRKSLYEERLDIIKSQGGQTWTPRRD